VKWFSKEKGYGFITDEKNQDFYFFIKDVKGQILPTIGSVVSFYPYQNEKGWSARSVTIKQLADETDLHVKCAKCKKKMIPRIIFERGGPHHSICPFCASQYKDFISSWKKVLFFFLDILAAGLGNKR